MSGSFSNVVMFNVLLWRLLVGFAWWDRNSCISFLWSIDYLTANPVFVAVTSSLEMTWYSNVRVILYFFEVNVFQTVLKICGLYKERVKGKILPLQMLSIWLCECFGTWLNLVRLRFQKPWRCLRNVTVWDMCRSAA